MAFLNGLLRRGFFRLQADPVGKIEAADSFVVLGFGIVRDAENGDRPGLSNLALANWLIKKNQGRKPTIVQYGIELALREVGGSDLDRWMITLPDNKAVYVNTRGALIQVWTLLHHCGLKRPAIVCAPMQSQRVYWLASKIMPETILPEPEEIPFDPESSQPWTRNPYFYVLFELLIARPMCFFHRWFNI